MTWHKIYYRSLSWLWFMAETFDINPPNSQLPNLVCHKSLAAASYRLNISHFSLLEVMHLFLIGCLTKYDLASHLKKTSTLLTREYTPAYAPLPLVVRLSYPPHSPHSFSWSPPVQSYTPPPHSYLIRSPLFPALISVTEGLCSQRHLLHLCTERVVL